MVCQHFFNLSAVNPETQRKCACFELVSSDYRTLSLLLICYIQHSNMNPRLSFTIKFSNSLLPWASWYYNNTSISNTKTRRKSERRKAPAMAYFEASSKDKFRADGAILSKVSESAS